MTHCRGVGLGSFQPKAFYGDCYKHFARGLWNCGKKGEKSPFNYDLYKQTLKRWKNAFTGCNKINKSHGMYCKVDD